jgi:DNA-binding CsgD family transcriptional regulator
VGHLVVFLNFAILCLGAVVAVAFLRLYRAWPTPAAFWQLALFLAFTFTMAVAALGAYAIVNIGFEPLESRILASLVLVGSAAMLFVLPHGSRARLGRKRGGRFSAFWAFASAFPLAGAVAILFATSLVSTMLIIGVSFIPFFGAILYTLIHEPQSPAALAWESWIALAVLCTLAAIEITWVLKRPPMNGYFLVTLPVAYLYMCWSAWRDRSQPPDHESSKKEETSIPEALAVEKCLTERELEIARGILEGRSNKELAGELGISENTTRNHIYNLYRKLGIQKRLDLVVLVRKYRSS